MAIRQAETSLEFVKVPVSAHAEGVEIDPTLFPVKLAFVKGLAEPEAGDWQDATWETDGDDHLARCLVGPGGTVELDPGHYTVWVRVEGNPEMPIRPAGTLMIGMN